LTLGAAERGQGVALAYGALIQTELADGKLVRLFDEATEPVLIYSLACLEGRAEVPKIAAFRTWIMAEVGAVATRLPASRMAPLHVAAMAADPLDPRLSRVVPQSGGRARSRRL